MPIRLRLLIASGFALACASFTPAIASAFERPFIGRFHNVATVGSTVPGNGDLNPYGIVTVPHSTGALVRGDTLISNFNDEENLQGTGTTIVQVAPNGALSVFAHLEPASLPGECPGGVGLTTALALLPHGFVVVGSLPTTNGQASTAQAGCLIVLDNKGHPVQTIAGGPINGPWDMTAVGHGDEETLFVTNVLNGTVASGETPVDEGTVVRISIHVSGGRNHAAVHVGQETVIATGFPERTDPAALVVGPTGVGLGEEGVLYVADTQDSRIAAVPDAMGRDSAAGEGGETVATGGYLVSPLGLAIAPNGDILTTNAANGDIVETTPAGAEFQPFDTGAGGGGLFGLTIAPGGRGVLFVNDTENTLDLLG